MPVRTVIERGPKGKRSVAFSLDWLGWSRGAKTPELALETLESYRGRYRPVADLAGMTREFDASGPLEVVEDRVGPGSTDFWGISFAPASTEQGPMSEAEFHRAITNRPTHRRGPPFSTKCCANNTNIAVPVCRLRGPGNTTPAVK